MSGKTVFDVPIVPTLLDLLSDIRNGVFRIPRFQRPFVWDDERRLMLFDSIAKGFSIGSLMVWRTSENLRCYESLGGFPLDKGVIPPAQGYTYIMDGHQRIVTLFTALMIDPEKYPESPENGRTSSAVNREEKRPSLPIYVELDERADELEFPLSGNRFRLWNRRGSPPAHWLPLWYLFDENRLDDYRDDMRMARKRQLANQANALSRRFKAFPIPLVPYFAASRELVAESFTRLNTSSQKMNELHIVHSLLLKEPSKNPSGDSEHQEFDLLESMQQVQEELKLSGWGEIEERLLLNALKIRWNVQLHATDPQDLKKKFAVEPDALVSLQTDALTAIEWMKCMGVSNSELLPYGYQLIGFIEVARQHKDPLSDDQKRILWHWFWRTCFTESFTGVRENEVKKQLDSLVKAVKDTNTHSLSSDAPAVAPIASFQRRWVRSRALLLLLQENAYPPRSGSLYEPGECPIASAEILFPRQFSSAHPAAYVMVKTKKELDDLRCLDETTLFDTEKVKERRVEIQEHHLISDPALNASRRQVWDEFLKQRLSAIHALERKRVEAVGLSMESPAEAPESE